MEFNDYTTYEFVWRNNGQMLEGDNRVEMKDAISVPNAAMFLPKVVSNIVKEAAEPLLVLYYNGLSIMLVKRLRFQLLAP